MKRSRIFAGLTAMVLSIGFVLTVLVACESPTNGTNGTNADPGVNSPNIVATWPGVVAAFAEGNKVVYLVAAADVTSDFELEAGQTLVLASNADIAGRSVAGNSVGALTIPANRTLAINGAGAALRVNAGSTLAVAKNGVLLGGSEGDLVIADAATLTLDDHAGVIEGTITVTAKAADTARLAAIAATGSARSTATVGDVPTLLANADVTTVIYTNSTAITGSVGVPEGKTLRATGTINDQASLGAVAGTAVFATATAFSGTVTISEGGELVLTNTTTLSAAVTGPGSLVLDRVAGTSITGAFGATKPAVSGAGTVSTTQETNLAALLGGFSTVTYDATTLLSAATGAALTSGKTLVSVGSVAQSAPLALGGGTISITTNAITASSGALAAAAFTGTGLITVSAAAGLDLGAATVAPTGIKLQTTDSGTVTTATTSSAVLGAILALNDGGTGEYVIGGDIAAITGTLTIPAGVTADSSATAGATFATGTGPVNVNGTLKVNAAATFAAVADEGGITIGDKGMLDIGDGTSFAPNGEALTIVSEGTGKLVTTDDVGLEMALGKAGTSSLLNVELGGTAELAAAATVKAGTVLTIGESGDLTASGDSKALTVTGSVVITDDGVLKTAANAAAGIVFAGGTISGSGIRITGTGDAGAGSIKTAETGVSIGAASLATGNNTKLTLTTAKIEILNNAAAPVAAITLTGEFTAGNQIFTFTGGIAVPTIAATTGTNGTLTLSDLAVVAITEAAKITLGKIALANDSGTVTIAAAKTLSLSKDANSGVTTAGANILGNASVTGGNFETNVGTFNSDGDDAVITGKTGGGTIATGTTIAD